MKKTNISKSLMFAIGAALLVGTIGFFMVGGKQSSEARAPTEPKLRVELK